jgi:hypothetical protein
MRFVHLPTFLHAVASASQCCDTEKSSPILSGVSVQVAQDSCVIVATTGKALAEWSLEVFQDSSAAPSLLSLPLGAFILSPQTFRNWGKAAKEQAQSRPEWTPAVATVSQDGQVFTLTYCSGAVEVSRLIEGAFPPYRPAFRPKRTWASFGDTEWAALAFDSAVAAKAIKGIDAGKEQVEHVIQGGQRGCLLYPLKDSRPFVVSRRGLVMPVGLPDDRRCVPVDQVATSETLDTAETGATSATSANDPAQAETIAALRAEIETLKAYRAHDEALISSQAQSITKLQDDIAKTPRIGAQAEADAALAKALAQVESEKARYADLEAELIALEKDAKKSEDDKDKAERAEEDAKDTARRHIEAAATLVDIVKIAPNTTCRHCGRDRLDGGHALDCPTRAAQDVAEDALAAMP